MKVSDFDYELPAELIAAHPAQRRDAARLMVVPRTGGGFEHRTFAELPQLLRPGDCLVLNESRVIPARLLLRRRSGGLCELLLLERTGEGEWEAIVRPARKLPVGERLDLPDRLGRATVVGGQGRTRRVRFEFRVPLAWGEFLARYGHTPLPPYILHRRRELGERPEDVPEDRERYQTVYARIEGSVAAPTAGLHFTTELLTDLERRGVELRRVVLHVGAGTFAPVEVEDVEAHRMHAERYAIDEPNATAIDAARRDPARRVVAVGTTAVRTLEACMARHGAIVPCAESTDLFIYPGFRFQVVDALITNFHLPRSTLLMLVAAFAGRERILDAYREAVARRYRFFSYGDAMLIE